MEKGEKKKKHWLSAWMLGRNSFSYTSLMSPLLFLLLLQSLSAGCLSFSTLTLLAHCHVLFHLVIPPQSYLSCSSESIPILCELIFSEPAFIRSQISPAIIINLIEVFVITIHQSKLLEALPCLSSLQSHLPVQSHIAVCSVPPVSARCTNCSPF